MCDCRNIQIGSYDNQVTVLWPFSNKFICIDRCLFDEITLLWSQDIITTGCCCGHNKQVGYIGVDFNCIDRMKQLGYEVERNNCRPGDQDSFKPKSI